jgi:hypothetical protein
MIIEHIYVLTAKSQLVDWMIPIHLKSTKLFLKNILIYVLYSKQNSPQDFSCSIFHIGPASFSSNLSYSFKKDDRDWR